MDKLINLAIEQLREGLESKKKRMDTISTIVDLYNNKKLDLGDDNAINIPFPIMSKQIDSYYAKIDEPPTLTFKIPNRKNLSEKIKQAWMQEMSSTRSGWHRKDRAEKKLALLSGRGIAKLYSSSLDNKFQSHYDVVDYNNFVADPTRGDLDKGRYHGEVNIFKTKTWLKKMADKGIYDPAQVEKLLNYGISDLAEGEEQAIEKQKERLASLDIVVNNRANEQGYNLVQWIMKYEDEWQYLLFDLNTGIWIRKGRLADISDSEHTPYVSWAVNYDEYNFWSKGVGDNILPSAEAIKFLLNTALENERRRTRPMRIVESGSLVDINELIDYVPDNVVLSNAGHKPDMVTVETPQITTTLNFVEFLNNFIEGKSGVGNGMEQADTKVGVYYGQLAQEADIIGTINKEYAESYAQKGYRFFWGLKKNLTQPLALEMLGKGGVKLLELSRVELSDIDNVNDIEVSGGAREEQIDMVKQERQSKAIADLVSAFGEKINPEWVIKTTLKREGFNDEDIQVALDTTGAYNQELMNEADESIQQIMLGHTPMLNQGATPAFLERIYTFAVNNLNWVRLDKNGKEIGIDRKKKQQFQDLMAYIEAHTQIVVKNNVKAIQEQQANMMAQQPVNNMQAQPYSNREKQLSLARPGETNIPAPTPQGTSSRSQKISQIMTP